MAEREPRAYRRAGAVLLGLVMLAAALAIHLVHDASKTSVERARRQHSLNTIEPIIPGTPDNNMATDVIHWQTGRFFPETQSFRIYRARQNGKPDGIVLMPVTVQGYNGPIKMAIGIQRDGRISGVTILSHQETPGLGAAIDPSRSDWLQQFRGQSLEQPASAEWKLARQGGSFDAISGATISSAAVLDTVRSALEFYAVNQEAVYRQKD